MMTKPKETKEEKRKFVTPKLTKHDSLTNATLFEGGGVSGAAVIVG